MTRTLRRLSSEDSSTERKIAALASPILTVINSVKYTILGFRALYSLGVDRNTYTLAFHISYLELCWKSHARRLRLYGAWSAFGAKPPICEGAA